MVTSNNPSDYLYSVHFHSDAVAARALELRREPLDFPMAYEDAFREFAVRQLDFPCLELNPLSHVSPLVLCGARIPNRGPFPRLPNERLGRAGAVDFAEHLDRAGPRDQVDRPCRQLRLGRGPSLVDAVRGLHQPVEIRALAVVMV